MSEEWQKTDKTKADFKDIISSGKILPIQSRTPNWSVPTRVPGNNIQGTIVKYPDVIYASVGIADRKFVTILLPVFSQQRTYKRYLLRKVHYFLWVYVIRVIAQERKPMRSWTVDVRNNQSLVDTQCERWHNRWIMPIQAVQQWTSQQSYNY